MHSYIYKLHNNKQENVDKKLIKFIDTLQVNCIIIYKYAKP